MSIESVPVRDFTSTVATGPHTTLQVVGVQLELYDAAQDTKTFVSAIGSCSWANAKSITCVKYHAPKQLLAIVVEGDDFTRAHVLKFQDQKLVCTIPDCSALSSVSFSHDGSVLYGVNGTDAGLLHAWEIPSGAPLVWRDDTNEGDARSNARGSDPVHRPCFPSRVTHVTADPFSLSRVVAYGDSGVYVCTLQKQSLYFTASVSTAVFAGAGTAGVAGGDNFLDTGLVLPGPGGRGAEVVDTSWASGALFLVTAAGQLVALNMGTGQISHVGFGRGSGVPATSVLCIVDFVVVGCADGTVQWLARDDYSVASSVALPDAHCPVTALVPLPSFQAALACQGQRHLVHVTLNVDEEAGPLPQPRTLRSSTSVAVETVLPLDAAHFLGVTDGGVVVLDCASEAVAVCYSGSLITACTTVTALGAVAVGDSRGAVTLISVDVAAPGSGSTVLGSFQAHSSPVLGLAVDEDLLACVFADTVLVCRLAQGVPPAAVAYARPAADAAAFCSVAVAAGARSAVVADRAGQLFRMDLAAAAAALPAAAALQPVAAGAGAGAGVVEPQLVQGPGGLVLLRHADSSRIQRVDVAGGTVSECVDDAGGAVATASCAAGGLCTVGTAAGAVQMWRVGSSGKAKLLWSAARFMATRAAAADPTGQRVVSVAVDGLVTVYDTGGHVDAPPSAGGGAWPVAALGAAGQLAAGTMEAAEQPSMLATVLEARGQAQRLRVEQSQGELLRAAQTIKDEAALLVQRNATAPELEKMALTEFCINMAGRDTRLSDNARLSAELRARMLDTNSKKEVLARRMKHLVWDSMRVPGREIHAFQSGVVVANFAIPRFSPAEQARLDRAVVLRRVELREMRFCAGGHGRAQLQEVSWPNRLDEVPHGVPYIANADLAALKSGHNQTKKTKKKQSSQGGDVQRPSGSGGGGDDDAAGGVGGGGGSKHDNPDDDEEEGDLRAHEGELEDLEFLLYHPCAVRTNRQRRTQVLLLRLYVVELMKQFNDVFEGLGAKKSDAMEQIASKNKRIAEIIAELAGHDAVARETVFDPVVHSMERPASIFTVADEEVPVERYVSEAEQRQLDEEAEIRRLAAEEVTDDPATRGLMDMMNGTLEAKTDGVASLGTVEKEAWMDQVPREKMSEEQLEAVATYEARLADYLEKKTEYEKAMVQELRKLKTEVAEVVRVFDDQLKTAFQRRLDSLRRVYVQQLYSFRLVQSLNQQQSCLAEERRLRLSLGQVQRQHACNETLVKRLTSEVTELKDRVDALKASDSALAASFKKTLQEAAAEGGGVGGGLDHDTLKIYQQLFKVRRARRRSSFGSRGSRTGTGGGTSSNRSSLMNRSRGSRVVRKASAVATLSPSHGGGSRSGRDSEMRAAMAAAVKDAGAAAVLDPYRKLPTAALADKAAVEREELLRPLTVEMDAPDGLKPDPELWRRLNELRSAKIESELLLKTMTRSMNESLAMVQSIEHETDDLSDRMNDIISQIEAKRALAHRLNWDCDVVLNVTQGQDEVRGVAVPGGAAVRPATIAETALLAAADVVTEATGGAGAGEAAAGVRRVEAVATSQELLRKNDYSDAMLVDRSVIETANEQVRRRGKDKIDVLTKIKDFRKNINFMEWENEFLVQKAVNLEAHYTDLHMLRVTKSLQQFLQGSAGDHNKKQITKAEATLKFNDTSFQDKSAKATKSLRKVERSITTTKNECEKLEAQKLAVAKRVAQLESVSTPATTAGSAVQASGRGGLDQAAKAKMKAVVTRRKLIDLARAQTDEIEFLRKELDRLRQRTFPSFAHSRRAELQRLGNPDEQY